MLGRAKVSSKGWVVIPKELREEMNLKPGDEVAFSLERPLPNMKQDKRLNSLRMIKVPATLEETLEITKGMFKRRPGQPRMTDRLLEERRREVRDEERKIRSDRRRRRNTA
jgi:AbrB family looped-hinge helix DNA binding protein